MADNVEGHIFDGVKTTAKEFSKITNQLANGKSRVIKGYGKEFAISVSGLNVTIQSGWAVIQGRYVYLNEAKQIVIPANYSGFIVLEIDLSKLNTSTGYPDEETYSVVNNQVILKLVQNVISGNLLDTDTLTQFALYTVSSTGTTATLTKNEENFGKYPTQIIDVGWNIKIKLTKINNIVYANLTRQIVDINVKSDDGFLPDVKNYSEKFKPLESTALVVNSNLGSQSTSMLAFRFSSDGKIYFTNALTGRQTIQGSTSWVAED